MIPDLGQPYLPDWGGAPPHMAPRDLVLWQRYRAARGANWLAVYYDVAVGDPAPVPEAERELQIYARPAPRRSSAVALADMWQRLTRQRIDAAILTAAGWTIIEVRPGAGPAALGALLSYHALWMAEPPDTRPVSMLLVTDRTEPNLEHVAGQLRIPIMVV